MAHPEAPAPGMTLDRMELEPSAENVAMLLRQIMSGKAAASELPTSPAASLQESSKTTAPAEGAQLGSCAGSELPTSPGPSAQDSSQSPSQTDSPQIGTCADSELPTSPGPSAQDSSQTPSQTDNAQRGTGAGGELPTSPGASLQDSSERAAQIASAQSGTSVGSDLLTLPEPHAQDSSMTAQADSAQVGTCADSELQTSPQPEDKPLGGEQHGAALTAGSSKLPAGELAAADAALVGLLYDPRMAEHRNLGDGAHPEQPLRVINIFSHLEAEGLVSRCKRIPCRLAEREELELKHSPEHVEAMMQAANLSDEDAAEEARKYDSFFLCSKSSIAGRLSAGSVIEAVARVCSGEVRSAVCVVRPPGHHAECNRPMGFCMFGNVAVAAAAARRSGWSQRILIIDWDVHHGNGTQRMFEEDPSVLYFSIHRHDNGSFYPSSRFGHYESHGLGPGAGYSVNVPWNVKGAWRKGIPAPGDAEYISTFERVLLPIAADFEPDLVLVSAGFDSARGDPLGDCRVSPAGFHKMTELVMQLAGGRVVLALEGGYNLHSISISMAACVSALLGDSLPPPPPPAPGHEGELESKVDLELPHEFFAETIDQVIRHFSRFWPSMREAADALKESNVLDVPEASLRGDLKQMRRALRHHAKNTGCSLEELMRQHARKVFKLDAIPILGELKEDNRRRALLQSFSPLGASSLPFMVPILHVQSCTQTIKNVEAAMQAGAHGVWLINSGDAGLEEGQQEREELDRRVYRTTLQAGSTAEHQLGRAQLSALAEAFQAAREAFPDCWIGLCVPQLNSAQAFAWLERHCATADGLWLDDLACRPADIVWESMGEYDIALDFAVRLRNWLDLDSQLQLQAVRNARKRCGWMGLVLGTVASRFQEPCHHDQDAENMGEACRAILSHWASLVGSVCDAIVTTGPGNGSPCAAAKLRALSCARPLACLGSIAGDRAGQGGVSARSKFSGGAELLLVDVAELAASPDATAEELQQARLTVDSQLLKEWVLTGKVGHAEAEYEPGAIREMATAALEETRKRRDSKRIHEDRGSNSAWEDALTEVSET